MNTSVLAGLREKRQATWDAAKAILDAAGSGSLTAEQRQSYDGLLAQIDDIDTDIQRADRLSSHEALNRSNPLVSGRAARNSAQQRAMYGEALPSGHGFGDLEGVNAKDTRAFGEYVRAQTYGETRDATEGTTTAGGALVPIDYAATVLDLTRNKLALANAGATVVPLNELSLKLARVDTDPTPGWRNETAAVASSDITFGQVTFTARSLAVMVKASMELLEDAPNFGDVLANSLAHAFALKLDAAGLYGTGAAPVPQGIYTASGVNVTAMGTNGAAPTNYDFLASAVQRLRTKNFEPTGIVYAPRTDGELGVLKDGQGRYLDAPSYLDGIPRVSTSQVSVTQTQGTAVGTASDAFVGDFSKVAIGMRTGFSLRVLRERYADTGEVGFLGWLRADIQILRTGAFEVIAGIL